MTKQAYYENIFYTWRIWILMDVTSLGALFSINSIRLKNTRFKITLSRN
jgi:hypothetical protein